MSKPKITVTIDLTLDDFFETLLKLNDAQLFRLIKKLDLEIDDASFRNKLGKYFNSKIGDGG